MNAGAPQGYLRETNELHEYGKSIKYEDGDVGFFSKKRNTET